MQNILKTVRQAVQTYNMIADGDKIAVGASGGKDSTVLLAALAKLSQFYPKRFSVGKKLYFCESLQAALSLTL